MKILTIIPARGGSKGIPGKNLKKIGNKTLIEWAVWCANESKCKQKILLNTDDESIAKEGERLKIEVMKRRPEFGTDTAAIADVIVETIENEKSTYGNEYDVVVLLQPTSPFRTETDFRNVMGLFNQPDVKNVVSVVSVQDQHPARMYHLNEQKLLPLYADEECNPRQKLTPTYLRNGCFYAIRTDWFLNQKSIISSEKHAYVMSDLFHVNIDTPRDLALANFLYPAWQQSINNGL